MSLDLHSDKHVLTKMMENVEIIVMIVNSRGQMVPIGMILMPHVDVNLVLPQPQLTLVTVENVYNHQRSWFVHECDLPDYWVCAYKIKYANESSDEEDSNAGKDPEEGERNIERAGILST